MAISISSPSFNSSTSTTAAGSRIARLLPHFETCIALFWIYPLQRYIIFWLRQRDYGPIFWQPTTSAPMLASLQGLARYRCVGRRNFFPKSHIERSRRKALRGEPCRQMLRLRITVDLSIGPSGSQLYAHCSAYPRAHGPWRVEVSSFFA